MSLIQCQVVIVSHIPRLNDRYTVLIYSYKMKNCVHRTTGPIQTINKHNIFTPTIQWFG